MLLAPIVAAKLASAAWRMARYHTGSQEHVLRGPPQVLIRVVVAPVLVASTVMLFGTGMAQLALDQTEGTVDGQHKASVVVWIGAAGVHFLTRIGLLWRALNERVPGISMRLVAATLTVVAGVGLATMMTLPGDGSPAGQLSRHIGFDGE